MSKAFQKAKFDQNLTSGSGSKQRFILLQEKQVIQAVSIKEMKSLIFNIKIAWLAVNDVLQQIKPLFFFFVGYKQFSLLSTECAQLWGIACNCFVLCRIVQNCAKFYGIARKLPANTTCIGNPGGWAYFLNLRSLHTDLYI